MAGLEDEDLLLFQAPSWANPILPLAPYPLQTRQRECFGCRPLKTSICWTCEVAMRVWGCLERDMLVKKTKRLEEDRRNAPSC